MKKNVEYAIFVDESTLESVLNMLAEVTAAEISKEEQPQTFDESKHVPRSGGEVVGNARCDIKKRTGKPGIT